MLGTDESPEEDLYHLAETQMVATLVISNIEHGLAKGGGSITDGDPHSCFTFVNPNLGEAAGVASCMDHHLMRAWLELVESHFHGDSNEGGVLPLTNPNPSLSLAPGDIIVTLSTLPIEKSHSSSYQSYEDQSYED
ncbi:hypothetical protein Pmani_038390 [Petrolisthes manimaculis]|uniref:Uncharacterized protein n=1 Tax=Petrolisthes manimaculis TaxID=1843537 RepID=A0AAE1NH05_9EUCA|nr:hypothetical protein Pmani_038390 [Petrolisthes manimaculis]